MGNFLQCISLLLPYLAIPFRRVRNSHYSLTAGVDMDVLDRDLLLTFAAVPLQGLYLQCEGPQ